MGPAASISPGPRVLRKLPCLSSHARQVDFFLSINVLCDPEQEHPLSGPDLTFVTMEALAVADIFDSMGFI